MKQRLHLISVPRTPLKHVCLDCVETRICKACNLHLNSEIISRKAGGSTQLSNMNEVNANHVSSEQNNYMWQCNACSQTFSKSFYSRWRTKHGEHKTQLVRCSSCVYIDEQKHKHEQATTFAMVMKQDSTNTTRLTTSDQHAAESVAMQTIVTVQV